VFHLLPLDQVAEQDASNGEDGQSGSPGNAAHRTDQAHAYTDHKGRPLPTQEGLDLLIHVDTPPEKEQGESSPASYHDSSLSFAPSSPTLSWGSSSGVADSAVSFL